MPYPLDRNCLAPLAIAIATLSSLSTTACAAPRQLASGVVRIVTSQLDAADTVSGPLTLHKLAAASADSQWQPYSAPESDTLYQMARNVVVRRPIWQLEFGFKPMRMTRAEWTDRNGRQRSGLVWYLVYYVRNRGDHLRPVTPPDASEDERARPQLERDEHAVRFIPNFVLEAHDIKKAYLDRTLPSVAETIRRHEDPDRPMFNSVDISRVPLTSDLDDDGRVWGIATWVDVDPRIDFFSIYVQGLTNAYRWEERPDAEANLPADAPSDVFRVMRPKTLQINFYRPGDTVDEHDEEIFVGPPTDDDPEVRSRMLELYRIDSPLEYLWIYR